MKTGKHALTYTRPTTTVTIRRKATRGKLRMPGQPKHQEAVVAQGAYVATCDATGEEREIKSEAEYRREYRPYRETREGILERLEAVERQLAKPR